MDINNIIDSIDSAEEEVQDAIMAALELYMHTNYRIVESRSVQIIQELLDNIYK